jgi:hypothetical protein
MSDDDDWGCDHCRNDGKLTEDGRCPKCDAIYDCEHVWTTDGMHANVFCALCFVSKPTSASQQNQPRRRTPP